MTRPVGFSQELADRVIDRIAEGEMLTKVCEDESMPTKKQFRYWLTTHDELKAAYARARLSWADHWAERVMEISFNPQGMAIDGKGNVILDHATIALLKLQTDNAKWLVGKWAPRTYGDKPADDAPGDSSVAMLMKEIDGRTRTVGRIERIIVKPGDLGTINSDGAPEPTSPPPPRQLEFKPEPPPANLAPEDWALMREVLALIKRTIPTNDDRPPAEIFEIIRKALIECAQ